MEGLTKNNIQVYWVLISSVRVHTSELSKNSFPKPSHSCAHSYLSHAQNQMLYTQLCLCPITYITHRTRFWEERWKAMKKLLNCAKDGQLKLFLRMLPPAAQFSCFFHLSLLDALTLLKNSGVFFFTNIMIMNY